MRSRKTLDKGVIHTQGGMEQDWCRSTSQKRHAISNIWITYFCIFPFNILDCSWLRAPETTEREGMDRGGPLYSEKPQSKKAHLELWNSVNWPERKAWESRAHKQVCDHLSSVAGSSSTKGRSVLMCPWHTFTSFSCKKMVMIIIWASYSCHEN